MSLKVAIVGLESTHRDPNPADSLLLRSLEIVSGSKIQITESCDAQLVVLYPYRFPLKSTAAGALSESLITHLPGAKDARSAERAIRRMYRISAAPKLLAVSHENLDRRPWQVFGNLISRTDIPRVTSWPAEVDSQGFRLPYWWNYVDWPEIPRSNNGKSSRVGRYYDLESLLEVQDLRTDRSRRLKRAVWITNHLDFPRNEILQRIRKQIPVDVVRNVAWGDKLSLLARYDYCVTTENSPGYGYETEKVPEARIAGCIPIGYIANPFSDFNPNAYFFDPPKYEIEVLPPLLKERPNVAGLMQFLAKVIA